jgi:hypothetical protein
MLLAPLDHYSHPHYLFCWQKCNSQPIAFNTASCRYIEVRRYTTTTRRITYLWPLTAMYRELWPPRGQTTVHTATQDFPVSVIYGCEYLKTLSTTVIAKLQCCISEVNWSLTAYSWPCVLHKVLFRKNGYKPQWKAISDKERTTACIVTSEGLGSLSGLSAHFKHVLCCLNPVVPWSMSWQHSNITVNVVK